MNSKVSLIDQYFIYFLFLFSYRCPYTGHRGYDKLYTPNYASQMLLNQLASSAKIYISAANSTFVTLDWAPRTVDDRQCQGKDPFHETEH